MKPQHTKTRRLPDMPKSIGRLPKDSRGYPVPWFVSWLNEHGEMVPARTPGARPDFRVVDGYKIQVALRKKVCWVCGETLRTSKTFVVGPMCAVNRISSEPPSHPECAIFAAKACPFMLLPKAKRREANMPEAVALAPGIMLDRNPGVALLWTTFTYELRNLPTGYLFRMGPPTDLKWFAEGRAATREEILHSIETGLPYLRGACTGQVEHDALTEAVEEAMKLLP